MTNFADKGIVVTLSWKAIEVDGEVVAVAPSRIANRIATAIRNAAEAEAGGAAHVCPVCESQDVSVIDSRRESRLLSRRRRCNDCDARWLTHERIVRLLRSGDAADIVAEAHGLFENEPKPKESDHGSR